MNGTVDSAQEGLHYSAGSFVRRRAFWDLVFLLVVFLAGSWVGSSYVRSFQKTHRGEFGQNQFAAAVSLACGHGFANPSGTIPALSDFLSRRTDRFSCDQLPAGPSPGPLDFTQGLYRYLMMAVALQWKWSGVSWSGLTPLFGMMFALTLCTAYGLFRLAGGPLVGLIGVVPLAVSAHHLGHLPDLRDYAKAPFILLLLALTAHLAHPPSNRRRSLLLACAFGGVLGIGFGFRNDLLISVPPFVAVVLFLLPYRGRDTLRLKAACLGVMSFMFVATAWPILTAYRSGSNTGHVAVLGLMSAFDGPLGVTRPLYDLGPHYLDGFAATVVSTHSNLRSGRFVDYLSQAYDRAALQLLVDVARHWPADVFVRTYASILNVLDFPFTVGRYTQPVPPGVTTSSLLHFYDWQMDQLRALTGFGPLLVAIATMIIAATNPQAAVALILLLIYYCGYPAVQFNVRHFFHLEFIPWWAMVFTIAATLKGVRGLVVGRGLNHPPLSAVRNAIVTAAVLVGLTFLALSSLRLYQQRHLTMLFEAYLRLPRTPLSLTRTTSSGRTLVAVDELWKTRKASEPFSVRYIVAVFTAERCGAIDLPVTMTYDARTVANDFSFVSRVPITSTGPTLRLVPAYYNGEWSHFSGFSIPQGYDACLRSASVIEDIGRVPVIVDLTLTPKWQSTRLFQRLAEWEDEAPSDAPLVRVVPPDLVAPCDTHLSRVVSLQADRTDATIAAAPPGRRWIGKIPITIPQQSLLHFPSRSVDEGFIFRAKGVLRRGGLLIGITRNEAWIDSRWISHPGPFIVMIRPPVPGDYGALVTDLSPMLWAQQPRSLLRGAMSALMPDLVTDEFELHEVAWIKVMP